MLFILSILIVLCTANHEADVVTRLFNALKTTSRIGGGSLAIKNSLDDTQFLLETFAQDVQGRSLPYGTFEGIGEAKTYFFGIANKVTDIQEVVIRELIVKQYSEGMKSVWVRVNLLVQDNASALGVFAVNAGEPYVVDTFGRFTLNGDNRIQAFDLVSPQQGRLYDFKLDRGTFIPEEGGSMVDLLVRSICKTHTTACFLNPQFEDEADCVNQYILAFLGVIDIPPLVLGSFDKANEDNLACRVVNLAFVEQASSHCPNLSPFTGTSPRCSAELDHPGIYWDAMDVYSPILSGSSLHPLFSLIVIFVSAVVSQYL